MVHREFLYGEKSSNDATSLPLWICPEKSCIQFQERSHLLRADGDFDMLI